MSMPPENENDALGAVLMLHGSIDADVSCADMHCKLSSRPETCEPFVPIGALG